MAREGEVKLGVQQVRVTLITWKCTNEYFEDLIMKMMKTERRRMAAGRILLNQEVQRIRAARKRMEVKQKSPRSII